MKTKEEGTKGGNKPGQQQHEQQQQHDSTPRLSKDKAVSAKQTGNMLTRNFEAGAGDRQRRPATAPTVRQPPSQGQASGPTKGDNAVVPVQYRILQKNVADGAAWTVGEQAKAHPNSKTPANGKAPPSAASDVHGRRGGGTQTTMSRAADKSSQKAEQGGRRPETVPFSSDAQSFPSLDQAFSNSTSDAHHSRMLSSEVLQGRGSAGGCFAGTVTSDTAQVKAPMGSWAKAGTSGSCPTHLWKLPNPLDATSNNVTGLLRGRQPQQHMSTEGSVEEEQWTTVAPKPKPVGRSEGGTTKVSAHAPSTLGMWAQKNRDQDNPAQASAASAASRGTRSVAHVASPASAAAASAALKVVAAGSQKDKDAKRPGNECKKKEKGAPILLSELIPMLQRKDVKMPTPYTHITKQDEADSHKSKAHKRSDNLVRNPNAADATSMVVLRRKEREGKKKTKISPLKKLILRDRRERLEREREKKDNAARKAAADASAAVLAQQQQAPAQQAPAEAGCVPSDAAQQQASCIEVWRMRL